MLDENWQLKRSGPELRAEADGLGLIDYRPEGHPLGEIFCSACHSIIKRVSLLAHLKTSEHRVKQERRRLERGGLRAGVYEDPIPLKYRDRLIVVAPTSYRRAGFGHPARIARGAYAEADVRLVAEFCHLGGLELLELAKGRVVRRAWRERASDASKRPNWDTLVKYARAWETEHALAEMDT